MEEYSLFLLGEQQNIVKELIWYNFKKQKVNRYGIDANPVFSGDGKDKAYDKQREKSAYYTACTDPGNPKAGKWLGSAAFYS